MDRFISFPRGSSERTFLYPVMKTLLSLGEREMRVIKRQTLTSRFCEVIYRINLRLVFLLIVHLSKIIDTLIPLPY